ncbi:hypothetical protein ACRAQ6_01655 [Erythrobacter sp. HA6-11]
MDDPRSHDHWDDFKIRHQAAVEYAQSAVKSLILVNGGALIALLTFIGNSDVEAGPRGMFWSFVWLGLGLASALFALFPSYVSQSNYMYAARDRLADTDVDTEAKDIRGDNAAVFAFLSLFSSLVLFLLGAFVALFAIL